MSNSTLVSIQKGAQTLRVHISAIEEHLRLGWKKVEEEAEKVAEKIEAGVKEGVTDIEHGAQSAANAMKTAGRRGKAGATTQQA